LGVEASYEISNQLKLTKPNEDWEAAFAEQEHQINSHKCPPDANVVLTSKKKQKGRWPELTNIGKESESTHKLYGEDAKKPGTFANTALLTRQGKLLSLCWEKTDERNVLGSVAGEPPGLARVLLF
jgi:hypothetical protein